MPQRPEVDAWFRTYENPMKPVVMRLREIFLAADARLDECIKWQTPTFTFNGNLASFNPRSKQHASLLFHNGAEIPGKFPRLEGTGAMARVMKVASLAEAESARPEIEAIVRAWCRLKDGEGGAAPPSRKRGRAGAAGSAKAGTSGHARATTKKPPAKRKASKAPVRKTKKTK